MWPSAYPATVDACLRASGAFPMQPVIGPEGFSGDSRRHRKSRSAHQEAIWLAVRLARGQTKAAALEAAAPRGSPGASVGHRPRLD